MNHQAALEQLTGRNKDSRKLANNTYLIRDGETIAIKLHQTNVVIINKDGSYTLNSGGWQTLTTKERINRYTPAGISQRQGVWYMEDGSLFYDGMTINEQGQPVKPRRPAKYEQELKTIKKQARAYSKAFVQSIKDSGLANPGGGDCWYCAFFDSDQNRKGVYGQADHISEHMKENYFVPSLLFNAIVDAGYNHPSFIYQQIQRNVFIDPERNLYKYIVKRLQKELK